MSKYPPQYQTESEWRDKVGDILETLIAKLLREKGYRCHRHGSRGIDIEVYKGKTLHSVIEIGNLAYTSYYNEDYLKEKAEVFYSYKKSNPNAERYWIVSYEHVLEPYRVPIKVHYDVKILSIGRQVILVRDFKWFKANGRDVSGFFPNDKTTRELVKALLNKYF